MRIVSKKFTRRQMLLGVAAAGAVAATASACSSGGGGGGGSTSGANGYVPGSAQLKVQLGPEVEGINYPDPWDAPKIRTFEKFGDGTTEFRVVGPSYPSFDATTNNFSTWLEEQTGVKVKYEVIPGGEEGRPKINAMLSSGDMPDAFLNGGGAYFSRSEVALYGGQGLFLPTDQLTDENCPEMLDLFTVRPELRPFLTAPDGNMYGMGYTNECYHCYSAEVRMWIQQEWLDAVGMDHPTTTDELRAVLEAFRDQNPSGLEGTVPMSDSVPAGAGGGLIRYLMAAYAYWPASMIEVNGDALEFSPTKDAFREGLRWIRGLFADGLIDANIFTQTPDQLKRKMDNADGPLVGAVYGYSVPGGGTADLANPRNIMNLYSVMAPVTGPDGKAYIPWVYDPYSSNGIIIPSTSKDPVAMARWADAMVSVWGTLNMQFGPDDGTDSDHLAWAEEGVLGIDGRQAVYTNVKVNPDNTNVIWWAFGCIDNVVDVRHSNALDATVSSEGLLYESGKAYEPFAVDKARYFSDPVYSSDQAAQLVELELNIGQHLGQSVAQFCLGQLDIEDDAAWQAYVDQYDALGLQTLMDIETAARNGEG